MKLAPPSGHTTINIGGVEYGVDVSGHVDITDPSHIEAAKGAGYTEAAAAPNHEQTGE